ncbi:response regulator transcription factor [Paraburkholderia caballeronis]|uniref:response regulator transcription factor n=1 Tax=Paraburkholderia caballeronis TaxID=416943 RepID=UPI00106503C8|nr:response regulator transcription factor [Paraburkholderia caballeronis]TDV11647.1 two-component system phosphate regulon response regulator OmpR [Paraburkholderia caballeronis]TDV14728.1 two-component system phosphate regulon response regulator OmpR [Paraburkholderia caballeronis]TDV23848.1 two-component system phosphate regulon response regulator OmpR [Paraburkholderia caballeronis]
MKQMILVVDSDAACRDTLRTTLQAGGFDVAVLYEPNRVPKRLEEERPALVIMSSSGAFGSGLDVLKTLRHRGDWLPVVMLGEGDDVIERIVALECGADDFVSKPFNATEVLLRTKRVLSRIRPVQYRDPSSRPPFRFDGFELDYASRTLTFDGKAVPLSENEYAMLNLFTSAPGQVLSRAEIARRMWPDAPRRTAVVSLYVHRLRELIDARTSAPELIRTIRARGYVFRPDAGDRNTHPARQVNRSTLLAESAR